jgi:hypothetical protein
MDQRIWSTCLYCLIRANYDLADCMKIRYKNLRFNSSKSSSEVPPLDFSLELEVKGGLTNSNSQTPSNHPFLCTLRILASSKIPKILASSFHSCRQGYFAL